MIKTFNSIFGRQKSAAELEEEISMTSFHIATGLQGRNLVRCGDIEKPRQKLVKHFSRSLREQKIDLKEVLEMTGEFGNAVLNSTCITDRHPFLKKLQRRLAYWNDGNMIYPYHTVSAQGIVCYISEQISPQSGMRILEIGSGSNYNLFFLSNVCKGIELYGIELDEKFFLYGKEVMLSLGKADVIETRIGDGAEGWPGKSFDVIYCTATLGHRYPPSAWFDQLDKGGRIIFPRAINENEWRILFHECPSCLEAKSYEEYSALNFSMKNYGNSIVTMDAYGNELDVLVGVQFVPYSPENKHICRRVISKLEENVMALLPGKCEI